MMPPDDLYDAEDRAWDLSEDIVALIKQKNSDSAVGLSALTISICATCKSFKINKKEYMDVLSITWDNLSARLNEDSGN